MRTGWKIGDIVADSNYTGAWCIRTVGRDHQKQVYLTLRAVGRKTVAEHGVSLWSADARLRLWSDDPELRAGPKVGMVFSTPGWPGYEWRVDRVENDVAALSDVSGRQPAVAIPIENLIEYSTLLRREPDDDEAVDNGEPMSDEEWTAAVAAGIVAGLRRRIASTNDQIQERLALDAARYRTLVQSLDAVLPSIDSKAAEDMVRRVIDEVCEQPDHLLRLTCPDLFPSMTEESE